MKKNATRGIIIFAILLVVFSAIAFVIPFSKNGVFWIAYLCGIFAILFQIYIFKSSFGKEDARSRFYGFPIARLGIYYLIVQLVISIAEIILAKVIPAWIVVIINLLILAFALIGCITTETMRDEIARQDAKLKKDVNNMRELQSISAALVDQCSDDGLKKELKKLADEFRYSDPISSEGTKVLEADLRSQIDDLQQAITDGDTENAKALCSKLANCLRERNRICSVNK